MDGLPITLIVKAPNQQIEDQTIKCKETWTIHELKGHLSEVYPCKPKKEEQKLIYSGQLLTDSVVLKDVLRCYDGQDTHTVHLVCTSPQSRYKMPTNNSNTTMGSRNFIPVDGNEGNSLNNSSGESRTNSVNSNPELRRRNVPDSTIPNAATETGNANRNAHINYWTNQVNTSQNFNNPWWNSSNPWTMPFSYNLMTPNAAPVGDSSVNMVAAQMAWMQQMQAQYMQFYAQMLQNSNITGGEAMGFHPFLVNQQFQQNVAEQQNTANNNQQPANAQVNQNVVNLNDNNAQADLENWDLLEYFYMVSRFAIMFAVIYFYSSPTRFLLVLVTGVFIYLYQVRYFQAFFLNNEPVENNNNEAANNNNNAPANNQQNELRMPENAAANGENDAQENSATPTQENQNENTDLVPANNQPSRLAITWTIITSFLTSLLPDAPNVI